uniref:Scm like with four mbt domains 2 n=1 Tax=Scophthalmus maximus TaxID=52904 RepID=A0A8D3A022_SCOMX
MFLFFFCVVFFLDMRRREMPYWNRGQRQLRGDVARSGEAREERKKKTHTHTHTLKRRRRRRSRDGGEEEDDEVGGERGEEGENNLRTGASGESERCSEGGAKRLKLTLTRRRRRMQSGAQQQPPPALSAVRPYNPTNGKEEEVNTDAESVAEEAEFSWEEYMEETGANAAPHTTFKHVELSLQSSFQPGMKLEVANKGSADTYWVATIITTCGQLLLLRFSGYGDDRKADFWCDVMTADLHPVGWCAQNDKTLMPPEDNTYLRKAIKEKHSDWTEFLVQDLTGSRTAPANLLEGPLRGEEHGGPDRRGRGPGAPGRRRASPVLARPRRPERRREAPPALRRPLRGAAGPGHLDVLPGRPTPPPRLGPGEQALLGTAHRSEVSEQRRRLAAGSGGGAARRAEESAAARGVQGPRGPARARLPDGHEAGDGVAVGAAEDLPRLRRQDMAEQRLCQGHVAGGGQPSPAVGGVCGSGHAGQRTPAVAPTGRCGEAPVRVHRGRGVHGHLPRRLVRGQRLSSDPASQTSLPEAEEDRCGSARETVGSVAAGGDDSRQPLPARRHGSRLGQWQILLLQDFCQPPLLLRTLPQQGTHRRAAAGRGAREVRAGPQGAAQHADQRRLQARTGPEGAAGAGGPELGMSGGDAQSQV